MKKNINKLFRRKISFCLLSIFLFSNTFAYSIITPRVNTNDILTKSLWGKVVDDLIGLMDAIDANITDITTINTNIGTINTAISNINLKFINGTTSTDAVYMLGNVGIGTTTPTQKLEVVGGAIKASGGFILDTRASDPPTPINGQMWLIQ